MATASAAVSKEQKSSPDLSKLGGMTNRVVQVTKHHSRAGAGQMVVPPWKNVSVDQITNLMSELPGKYGPGTYKFEVYDEGGPEKDTWIVRLGSEAPEIREPGGNGYMGIDTNHGVAAMAGSRDLGGGYRYNEDLGLLITPDKQIHAWRPGEDLPGRLPKPVQPWGTAWANPAGPMPTIPGMPGWGNIPIDKGDDDKVRALEEQLKEERRSREAAEQRREAQEMFARMEKQRQEDNARFEQLITRLTEKPAGPSPELLAMQEQNKKLEQQAEQARRDAEQARRDAEHKADMRAMQEAISKAAENKQDPTAPFITMLGQIMSTGQTSQAEVVKAMRDSAQAQAQSAERNAMTLADRLSGSIMSPIQIVELMKKNDDGQSTINKSMVEMFQNLFGMAQGLVREQAQLYSQGEGPAWLPIAQEGVQTLGRVAAMYAQSKARQEGEQSRAERAARMQQMRYQAAQQVVQQPQQQMIPVAAPVRPKTPAELQRDQIAAQVGLVAGAPANSAQSTRDAAADSIFGPRDPNTGKPAGRPAAAAPVQAPAAAQVAQPAPAATGDGGSTPAGGGRKKRSRRRRQSPAQAPAAPAAQTAAADESPASGAVVQPDGSIIPASTVRQQNSAPQPESSSTEGEGEAVEPSEEEVAQLNEQAADAQPEDLRIVTDQMNDDEFFGPALGDVTELRQKLAEAPETLKPADIAAFILTARQQLLSYGIFPPAAEMLDLGHVEILVERLIPDAPEAAHVVVVKATRDLMRELAVNQQDQQGEEQDEDQPQA